MGMTATPVGSAPPDTGGAFKASDYVTLFFELFEFSSDAVWITRPDDGFLYEANGAFLSLFDLSRQAAIGKSTIDLGLWAHPIDRDVLVRKLRESGRVERYPIRVRVARSGEFFTLSVSEVIVPWRDEEVILAAGTVVHEPSGLLIDESARVDRGTSESPRTS
jgi:PAS domain S-box-containing protein